MVWDGSFYHPFIFGREGEEAQKIAKQGIPFDIVPGVTSAVGVLT